MTAAAHIASGARTARAVTRRATRGAAVRTGRVLKPYLGVRGIRIGVDLLVATLVVSLPVAAAASQPGAQTTSNIVAAAAPLGAARAQLASRATIAAGRTPVTVAAPGAPATREHTVAAGEDLQALAAKYGISAESIAYANGMTGPEGLATGKAIRIPPGNGALYTVKDGDTVESVAAHFAVDPKAVMETNRLYFEPEHFAPGRSIFIAGAALPALVYIAADPEVERPTVIARAQAATVVATGASPTVATRQASTPAAQMPARQGRLALPVAGLITQYFWYGHSGVDIATAYGTGIGASEAGVVSATGWVPVGGLRACVQHAGGLETCYYHVGAVFVSPGQAVERGQIIASIGMTGVTTGPHVHWEAKIGGRLVDPLSQ